MLKRLFFLLLLIGIFFPLISLAVTGIYQAKTDSTFYPVCYEGLVPCGKIVHIGGTIVDGKCSGGYEKVIHCQFCHFFVMLDGIVDFVLINIIPPLAVLMIVIAGIMFYLGGAKPDLLTRARKLINGVVIGLFLIYGSYMIIGIFLSVLGAAEWTGLANWAQGFFSFNCPIEIP